MSSPKGVITIEGGPELLSLRFVEPANLLRSQLANLQHRPSLQKLHIFNSQKLYANS